MKHFLSERGLALASPGSALWAFEKTGTGWTPKTTVPLSETDTEQLMKLMEEIDGHDDVEEVFTNASMLGRFDAAAGAYKEPLVLQRTAEARTALLVTCGESFVGMLMPIRPDEDTVTKLRGWQDGWVRRLPEPDPEPVAMPQPGAPGEAEEPDGIPADIPAAGQGTDDATEGRAHPNCHGPSGHVCQKPSGVRCVEVGCVEPAGTLWSDLGCPEHDMDRVSAGLESVMAQFQEPDPVGAR
jgi:hypothetical protein